MDCDGVLTGKSGSRLLHPKEFIESLNDVDAMIVCLFAELGAGVWRWENFPRLPRGAIPTQVGIRGVTAADPADQDTNKRVETGSLGAGVAKGCSSAVCNWECWRCLPRNRRSTARERKISSQMIGEEREGFRNKCPMIAR